MTLRKIAGLILAANLLMIGFTNCSNGTSNSASTTSTATSYTYASFLSLTYSGYTLGYGQAVTLTASGGTGPYTITKESGAGTYDSTTSVYTSAQYDSTTKFQVVDANGYYATFYIYVSSSSSSNLALSVSASTISSGDSVKLTPSGGVYPYTLSIYSGTGSISGSYFIPNSSSDLVVVQVQDYNGTKVYATIRVLGNAVVNQSGTVTTDDKIGVGFDTKTQSLDGDSTGSLTFYSMGTTISAANINTNVANCARGTGIDMGSPCVLRVPLTNYSLAGDSTFVYKGSFSIAGRAATVSANFCIRPSEPKRVYLSWTTTYSLLYQSDTFASGMNYLFSGHKTRSAYNSVDSTKGTGSATIKVTSAAYTTSTTCGAGFDTNNYIELVN